MSRAAFRSGVCVVLSLVLLLGVLAGCGKKGGPVPPEGEASRYTYPQTYPNPASVLPAGEPESEVDRRAPAHAGGLTVFPTTSRTKTTYGSGDAQ